MMITIVQRFCREVITWKSLHHLNMPPLLGATMRGKHFAMVSEQMSDGSINEFIVANQEADQVRARGYRLVPSRKR